MTFEFAQTPKWEDLDLWRQLQPNEDAIMLDPATGEPVNPDMPHRWLLEDPRLAEGYAYLQANRDRINIRVVFGRHVDATDLGNQNEGWFEQRVAESDAVGIESVGWDRLSHAQFLGSYALSRQMPATVPRGSFRHRVLAALGNNCKPSFSYDLESSGSDLDRMLVALTNKWKEPYERGEPETPELQDWLFSQTCIREWYAVGKLGYELKRLGILPPNGDPINVLMTIGDLHRDLVRKVRALGPTVKVTTIRPHGKDAEYSQGEEILKEVMSTGRVIRRYRHELEVTGRDDAPAVQPPEAAPTAPARSSLEEVVNTVEQVVEALPHQAVLLSVERISRRIDELQAGITPANQTEVVRQIEILTEARFTLLQAFDSMDASSKSVQQLLQAWGC